MYRILLTFLFATLLFLPSFAQNPTVEFDVKSSDIAGTIQIELLPDRAPATVKNFLNYADSGFYNGTIFHRIIDGFMIQGGGFTEKLREKNTLSPIKNEATNGLKNKRGYIAMARTSIVNSATSQFFINVVDNPFLDHRDPSQRGYGYAVFGRVVRGMNIVDQIRKVPVGVKIPFQNLPKDPVVIVETRVIK